LGTSKKTLLIVGAIALLVLVVGAILPAARTEVIVLDALVPSTNQIEIRARLVRGRAAGFLRGVPDATVSFTVDGGSAGRAVTDRRGVATLVLPMNDPGNYVVQAVGEAAEGDSTVPATGLVRVQHHRQRILAVDLDGPLAAGSCWKALLQGSETIAPVASAASTLDALSRTFAIVYVTSRDEDLSNPTKAWLEKNGFPRGPVFFSRTFHDPFGYGRHLPTVIGRLKRGFPLLEIGVCDTAAEARAFLREGVKPFAYGSKGEMPDGTQEFAVWEELPLAIGVARSGAH
jgi:hypothetical protein